MKKDILIPVSALMLLAINLVALNFINSSNQDYSYYAWAVVLLSAVIFGIVAFKKLNDK